MNKNIFSFTLTLVYIVYLALGCITQAEDVVTVEDSTPMGTIKGSGIFLTANMPPGSSIHGFGMAMDVAHLDDLDFDLEVEGSDVIGVRIFNVPMNHGLDEVGYQDGELIIEINGVCIDNNAHYPMLIIEGLFDDFALTVLRDGKEVMLN